MTRRTPALVVALATLLVVLLGAQGCRGGDPSAGAQSTPSGSSTSRGPSGGASRGASSVTDDESGLVWVDAAALPDEAQETLLLIDDGGPFPYDQDGSRFGNYEGLLPAHRLGYYEEYTVGTPGRSDRGARRLVVGEEDEIYWTADHYDSFRRVRR